MKRYVVYLERSIVVEAEDEDSAYDKAEWILDHGEADTSTWWIETIEEQKWPAGFVQSVELSGGHTCKNA